MSAQITTEKKSLVPAVDQAAQILVYLGKTAGKGKTVTEICRDCGLHKSKGYSILKTLMQYAFILKDETDKTYRLGPGLVSLGRHVLDHMDLGKTAEPHLTELVNKTGYTALLGVIKGTRIFITARCEGDAGIGITMRRGHDFHITHGSHGKAICAFMNPAERERILDSEELSFYGDGIPVDMNTLHRELEECRIRGFASDPGETNPGIHAVSSPVFDHHDQVAGCIILIGTFDLGKVPDYGPLVVRTAEIISGMSGSSRIFSQLEGKLK